MSKVRKNNFAVQPGDGIGEEFILNEEDRIKLENFQLKAILLQKQLNEIDAQFKDFILEIQDKYNVRVVQIVDVSQGKLRVIRNATNKDK